MFPEYMIQQIADTDSVVPIGACIEESGFDTSAFIPRVLQAFQTQGVQWSMPFNVSNPVLYYIRPTFEQAGLDPDDPPVSLEELRAYGAGDRRLGRGGHGHRPRLRRRLRRRVVPRAVVRHGWASRTPTTATAGRRRRRGCCTTAPPASS